MKKRSWKIAGINFDHFHMGDLLRYAHEHPNAEIVGISDEQPARMEEAVRKGLVARDRAFTDYRECLEKTKPDVVLLFPAASKHGEWGWPLKTSYAAAEQTEGNRGWLGI